MSMSVTHNSSILEEAVESPAPKRVAYKAQSKSLVKNASEAVLPTAKKIIERPKTARPQETKPISTKVPATPARKDATEP